MVAWYVEDNARWYLRQALGRNRFDYVIGAQPSRRIPDTVRAPYSGVTAARLVRATWGEADCWVVALGSNDLIFSGGSPGVAVSMIAVVTPGSRAWWVNLNYRRDPRYSFDFAGATAVFNEHLLARAAVTARLTVIDWHTLSAQHPGWFFDPVHVDSVGSRSRAEQVVAALVG